MVKYKGLTGIIKKASVVGIALLVTVSAATTQAEAANKFKDVSPKYWAYESISDLTDLGIIKGHTDGTYRPHDEITRAQSAMMIVRTLGISTANRPNPNFKDVTPKTAGYAEIATLVDMGVLSKATRFNPSKPATRAQMAKMLTLAFELEGTSPNTQKFKDVPKNHFFYSYVDKLVANEVTSGTAPDKYSPNADVTRVQMAVFLDRILELEEEAVKIPTPVKPKPTEPVEPKPTEPVEPKPTEPVEPKPTEPVEPKPTEPVEDDQLDEAQLAEGILKAVNAERAKAKVPALKIHTGVQKIAEMKSKDMAENNYYAHLSPTYGSYSDMLNAAGITRKAGGENLLVGYTTPEAVVKGWMESPGHKKNILNPDYTHTGVASHSGGDYGMYHTQIFIQQ